MRQSRLAILIAGNFFVASSFFSVTGLLNEIAAALNVSVASGRRRRSPDPRQTGAP
jgi:predicted MFS family arabinose efflux permease